MTEIDPSPRRILLVDPEPGFRRILREQLEQNRAWRPTESASIEAATAAVARHPPDMVVVTVSGRSGRLAIAGWRRHGFDAPVVALVEVAGPDVEGASLTIRKPVRLAELLAAIVALSGWRAPVSRDTATTINAGGSMPGAPPRTIGPYRFDLTAKQLVEPALDRTIRLTEKEAAILDLLWHADGMVVGRDHLLAKVWGYHADVSTHTLETHIYRLRRKIERASADAELLVTEAGGYRLVR